MKKQLHRIDCIMQDSTSPEVDLRQYLDGLRLSYVFGLADLAGYDTEMTNTRHKATMAIMESKFGGKDVHR